MSKAILAVFFVDGIAQGIFLGDDDSMDGAQLDYLVNWKAELCEEKHGR